LFQINNAYVTVFRRDSIPHQSSLTLDPSISGTQSWPQGLAATRQTPAASGSRTTKFALTPAAGIGY
jgi:hypothetical protein